jgi:NAD(P)-dependent dehydrogenase (short-subunit alcohol dehydrogenase family)
MLSFDGRVFAVTGGGGGIGREYCLLLARLGASIVVNDLGSSRDGAGGSATMADGVVEEIAEAGGKAFANHESVSSPDGAASIVATALENFGRLDGVVSNAGILRDASFGKMTPEAWTAVHQVHLDGAFHVSKAAWPAFRDQGYGRLVLTSSSSGLFGNFGQANYASAKMGLIGLMNSLAIEGSRHGIHVNAVAPVAATRMTEDVATADVLEKIPPAHIAPVVAYLLSDKAGSGDVVMAGGGEVKRVRLYESRGYRFDDVPSVDQVEAEWDAAMSWDGAMPAVNPAG